MTNREWLFSLSNKKLAEWLTNTYEKATPEGKLKYTGLSQITDKYMPNSLGLQVWFGLEHKD